MGAAVPLLPELTLWCTPALFLPFTPSRPPRTRPRAVLRLEGKGPAPKDLAWEGLEREGL